MLWQGEEKVEERKLRWVRENVVLPNRIDNDRLRRLLARAQPISPALISYVPVHALAHLAVALAGMWEESLSPQKA
jgi:hypothetical protein